MFPSIISLRFAAKSGGSRTTLLYDHETEVTDSAASVLKANQILDSFRDLPEESRPHIFIELAHELRKLQFVELYDFFMSIEDVHARRFALDAVPLLKTDAGVDFMLDRIRSDELDAEKEDRWFYSLNFYKNPTKYMISALTVSLSSFTALLHI